MSNEPMTLEQVRDDIRAKHVSPIGGFLSDQFKAYADAIDAHLTSREAKGDVKAAATDWLADCDAKLEQSGKCGSFETPLTGFAAGVAWATNYPAAQEAAPPMGVVTDAMVRCAMQAYISETGTADTRGDDLLPIDDEGMRAALTAALTHPRPTGDDHHKAWLAVVETLNVASPDWCCDGDDPIHAACAAIRERSGTTGEQAGEVVAWRWRSPAEVEFGKGWNLTADAEFAVMLRQAEGHQVEPLSSTPAVGVPDGWQLVPLKSTDAMHRAFTQKKYEDREGKPPLLIPELWEAMLAAAPAPGKGGEA